MRKVIQIAAAFEADDEIGGRTVIAALCDDGSVWDLWNRVWNRCPDIPQDAQPPQPVVAPTATGTGSKPTPVIPSSDG
jgi:hypothetical protein